MPFPVPQSSYRCAPAHAKALAFAAVLGICGVAEERSDAPAASTTPITEDREGSAENGTAPPPTREDPTSVRPVDPPPDPSVEQARGPDVTLIAGEERTVYEYRQNGKLRMIKVVPKIGKPYFLAPRDPTTGFGDLEQADTLVPRWVLIEF